MKPIKRKGRSGIWTSYGERTDAEGTRVVMARNEAGYPSEFTVSEWVTMEIYETETTPSATPGFVVNVQLELQRARAKHAPINSLHEGYAVIAEELDELWDQVRMKSELRDIGVVYHELIQIAAMAQRTAEDVIEKHETETQDCLQL